MGSLRWLREGEAQRILHADDEEADTRLLLHAKSSAKDVGRGFIQSFDSVTLRRNWLWRAVVADWPQDEFQGTKLLQDLGHCCVRQFLPFTHSKDGTPQANFCLESLTQKHAPRKLSTVRVSVRFRRKNGK